MRGFVSITGFLVCLLTASARSRCANDPLQESTEAFFPFARDGTLTVENTDGSIHIYGWNEPRVRLVALRKAYTASRLHEIRVETNAQPASIAVRTRIPVASGFFADRSGTVDYTIVVPETARLEKLSLVNGEIAIQGLRGGNANAEIVNGKITALNCFAHVRGRAVNGAMEAFFDWWEDLPARFDYVIRVWNDSRETSAARALLRRRTDGGREHHGPVRPAKRTQWRSGQDVAARHHRGVRFRGGHRIDGCGDRLLFRSGGGEYQISMCRVDRAIEVVSGKNSRAILRSAQDDRAFDRADLLQRFVVLIGLREQPELSITLFPLRQRRGRLIDRERVGERFDRGEVIDLAHFQFTAILPGRGKIRVELGGPFDSIVSLGFPVQLGQRVARFGVRAGGFWIELDRPFRIGERQARLSNFIQLPRAMDAQVRALRLDRDLGIEAS